YLQLPWIERCCGRARLSVKRVDIGNIKSIYKIEHVENAVECYALGQPYPPANAEIGKDSRRTSTRISSEIAGDSVIEKTGCLKKSGWRVLRRDGFVTARVRRRPRRDDVRPVRVGTEVEVRIGSRQDRKWASGTEFDDRRDSPITEKPTCCIASVHLAGLINRAPHKSMPLVENRIGALVRMEVVLRRQRCFKIRRIVDCVRPRVGRQHLPATAEALAQIRRKAVI